LLHKAFASPRRERIEILKMKEKRRVFEEGVAGENLKHRKNQTSGGDENFFGTSPHESDMSVLGGGTKQGKGNRPKQVKRFELVQLVFGRILSKTSWSENNKSTPSRSGGLVLTGADR